MRILWPQELAEKDVNVPSKILEQQGEMLYKLTNELVFASSKEISKIRTPQAIRNDFNYEFVILGKTLEDYEYRVFFLTHDITMYPFKLKINIDIMSEIEDKINKVPAVLNEGSYLKIENEESFYDVLEIVFNSERIKDVISSILKLSS